MTTPANDLARLYATAMRTYLTEGDERALQRAYEIGRKTIAEGLGVMDLAKVHEETVVELFSQGLNPAENPRLCRLTAAFFCESLWAFEMMQRGFLEANLRLRELNTGLQSRARELALANDTLNREVAERRRAEQALRESEENLQALSRQILTSQEEERQRISRELHDEVGQALTAINMNLTLLRKQAPNRSLARSFADLQGLLEQTMETVHSFTRELRPAMLDHLGLIPALRAYVRNFCKRTGLRVRFMAAPDVEALGINEKTVLYRVTQEGLTNVAKHAQASRAAVIIRKVAGTIQMQVRDNGKAFCIDDVAGRNGRKRLGLLGIQERVRLVKGHFELHSEPGKGTTIQVQIPLKLSGAKAN